MTWTTWSECSPAVEVGSTDAVATDPWMGMVEAMPVFPRVDENTRKAADILEGLLAIAFVKRIELDGQMRALMFDRETRRDVTYLAALLANLRDFRLLLMKAESYATSCQISLLRYELYCDPLGELIARLQAECGRLECWATKINDFRSRVLNHSAAVLGRRVY